MRGLGAHAVFVDSNILYSRTLRDWLCLLATDPDTDVFDVFWTEDVIADAIHHLRKNHPTWQGAKTARIRDNLMAALGDGRVDDFVVDGSYRGKDPDDAHVHAAAVACQADILLTANTGDFVSPDPHSLPYDVMGPDEFFVWVDDHSPQVVRSVTKQQMSYWVGRRGEADLPLALRNATAPQFAERVRLHQLALDR